MTLMKRFFEKFKNISPYVYGLGFVTFFMQFGATLVYGTSNNIVSGRLLAPASLVFLRSCMESISTIFKMIAGYISDRINNRTIFLIIGYGAALFLKICFFLTTLDLNIQFLAGVYIFVFIIDRLANALRDPTKEAFIAEQSNSKDRLISFCVRKGIGSMGTFVGGIIAFLLIKNGNFSASHIYFLAIFPVVVAVLILWIMFVKKNKTNMNDYYNLALKISGFSIFFGGVFGCLKYDLSAKFGCDFLNLIFAGSTLIFLKFRKNLLNNFLIFIFSFFFIKVTISHEILLAFQSNISLLLNILIYLFIYSLYGVVLNYILTNYTKMQNISKSGFVLHICLFLLVLTQKSSKLYSDIVSNTEFLLPNLKYNILFDSTLFKLVILFVLKKADVLNKIFHVILFIIIKTFFVSKFGANIYGYETIIYNFFATVITILFYKTSEFLSTKTKDVNILCIYSFISNLFILGSPLLLMKTVKIYYSNSLYLIGFFILFSRLITTKNIFKNIYSDASFSEFLLKTLPVNVFIYISLIFAHDTGIYFIPLALLSSNIFDYLTYKLQNNLDFFNICNLYQNFIFLPFIISFLWLLVLLFGQTTSMSIYHNYISGGMIFLFFIGVFVLIPLAYITMTFLDKKIWRTVTKICILYLLSNNFYASIIGSVLIDAMGFIRSIVDFINSRIKQVIYLLPIFLLGFFENNLINTDHFCLIKKYYNYIAPIGFGCVSFALMPSKNRLYYFLCSFLCLTGFIFGLYSITIAWLILFGILGLFYNIDFIKNMIMKLHIVKIFIDDRSQLKEFWSILLISFGISVGKLNDGFFLQRAVELNYKTHCALIFAFMYLFFTVSSMIIPFFEDKKSNKKSLYFLTISLSLCNLLMSGFIPFLSEKMSFFLSLFFYGMYTGAFDLVIGTAISKSTNNNKILGSLFGFFYFASGVLGFVLSLIFFPIVSNYGCKICALIASFPPVIAMLFI